MKKRIVILGAGESGVGAALLAKRQGYDVFVSDASAINPVYKKELIANEIEFEEGHHTDRKNIERSDCNEKPGNAGEK